jgi:hypothetical protein
LDEENQQESTNFIKRMWESFKKTKDSFGVKVGDLENLKYSTIYMSELSDEAVQIIERKQISVPDAIE